MISGVLIYLQFSQSQYGRATWPTWWNGRHKRLKISGLSRPCRFESGRGYHVLGDVSFKIKHAWLILRKRELKWGQKGTLLGQKQVSADAGIR